jgi:uncharacterized BrkB/YihY/UPF0761 family membrane protein
MPDYTETDTGRTAPPTRRERLRSAVGRARGLVDDKRETSTTVSIAFDAFGHDTEAGGPVLAAALGFRVFLFMVPYVAFSAIVGGYVADLFNRDPVDLFSSRGIGSLARKGIQTGQDLSTFSRISALVFVTYALFLSARSFVKVLRIVHTLVWRLQPSRLRHPTRATLVFVVVVTCAVLLGGAIDALTSRVVVGAVVALTLYTLVPFALWWVVSWWLPHGDSDPLGLVPGAAVFAVGVQLLHIFTVVWIPHQLNSKSEMYGAIGAALVLLFWAYLFGRLMTIAAALNVALWRRRAERPPAQPSFMLKVPLIGNLLGRTWDRLIGRTRV